MEDITCREYDIQNRAAIEYYKTLPDDDLDKLIAAKEAEIKNSKEENKNSRLPG